MQIATLVGPYRVLSRLGQGGMGEVWLAEDTRLHRQVALKTVRPADDRDAASRVQLMREARAAAALNHPHIATVHDVLEDRGEVVIVFEYVEGETLHARIARDRIPAPEAVEIASQIAKALVAAHAQGIVHRDLKPANIIIAAGGHVKVLDFGIARRLSTGTTQTSGRPHQSASGLGFVGTASYAAPEQLVSSAVDERADLYALGVVLFEMISGKPPFAGSDLVQLASSKLGKDAPPLSSTGQLVSAALEDVVARLLERDRDRRPASASEVLTQLRAIYSTPDTGSMAAARRGRSIAVVAASVLAVMLAGVSVWQFRQAGSGDAAPVIEAPPVVAVLRLANMSGDSSRDFVAAGIAESLISSLATLPSVTVLSRASVNEAQTRLPDGQALAKELGTTYIVEGSLQESAGTLRVSLNLVRRDRTVAWADSVEGKFDKIFELQSLLASRLAQALSVRVSAAQREQMASAPTTDPAALSAYWQGMALMERRDVKGTVEAAISAFGAALRSDPRFALAHAGLGQAYRLKYIETRDPAWAQRAIEEAANALRIDPNRAEVRYVMGLTLSTSGRLNEATEELNHALAIQPNFEDARRQLGEVLADQGQIDAAVTEFQKAIALRPSAAAPYRAMGLSLVRASRYEQAVAAFEQVVKIEPDNFSGYQQLGTAYQFLGRVDDALANYRKALAIRPSAPAYSNTGALLHQKGDFKGAVDAYQHAIEIRPNSSATRRNLGDALSRLGRTAEAKAAYLEAVRLGEADLKVNPSDPRLLAAQAVYLYKAGQRTAAAERMHAALTRAPESSEVLYRAAVIKALGGERDQALSLLERAVERGYSRLQIRSDDDLASLSDEARYRNLATVEAR